MTAIISHPYRVSSILLLETNYIYVFFLTHWYRYSVLADTQVQVSYREGKNGIETSLQCGNLSLNSPLNIKKL